MVRPAVRQAHGPEQSRRTHHPKPSRGANPNFKFSKDQNEKYDNGFIINKNGNIFLFKAFEFLSFDIVSAIYIKLGDIRYSDF